VLNFSVLDGWWAEGYVPGAGWAIKEQITYHDNRLQDELDAATLYSTIEEEIVPTFYTRDPNGIPTGWVKMMKDCFAKISPHYTMKRQLDDYYDKFYHKLEERHDTLRADDLRNVRQLLRWKEKVVAGWSGIKRKSIDFKSPVNNTFYVGETLTTTLGVRLGNLSPDDIKVEMLFAVKDEYSRPHLFKKVPFELVSSEKDVAEYQFKADAKDVGLWDCVIRIIPKNDLLPHDLDFNLVKWM
jgi:glucan phosphorylase